MITVKNFVFNPFQVNTFVLSDESGECIIIDAACYGEKEQSILIKYITDNNLKPVKLINTHCHVDHILGNKFVELRYSPEIEAHKDEKKILTDAKKHGLIFGFNVEEPPAIKNFLNQGDVIKFGNSSLNVLHIPGHSPGSIAIYSPEQNFIITGDVLFKGSIGRTDLPGGDYDALMAAIYEKLMTLPAETIVYPGHGPSTSIHEEALSNPFLT